jgi:Rrf2 family transcriptional regulator, nitric oxide-sensitive transcriptional repressor
MRCVNWYCGCHFMRLDCLCKWEIARSVVRLTVFTDFGLRALMRLAGEPNRSLSTSEIASEFGISRDHLLKVVRDLVEAGYVTTQRGVGGGLRLARPSQSIRLGEVVRALEQRHALVECFRDDGGRCVLTPKCRLKSKLMDAREAFFIELDRSTLAECAYPSPPRSVQAGDRSKALRNAAHEVR